MTVWNSHQRRGGLTAGVTEAGEHHQLSREVSLQKDTTEHGAQSVLPGGWQGRKIAFAVDKKRNKLVSLLIFRVDLFRTKFF